VPRALLATAAVVLLLDVGLRTWRPLRANVAGNLALLGIAWISFFALPHVGPRTVTVVAAAIAVVALFDFARMVGLSPQLRFFLPALALTVACFPLAQLGGRALSAVPVIALLTFATVGAGERESQAFLQKLALAWLAVMVYGYLYAHAVLYVQTPWPSVRATSMLAIVILMAKVANVAWLAGSRLAGLSRARLFAAPFGGAAGGWAVAALWPEVQLPYLPAIRLVVGLAMGAGTRAHVLIVGDVTGEREAPRKGTMMFGFGLALASGYWMLALDLLLKARG